MAHEILIDVCVPDPPFIDELAYALWLQGYTAEESSAQRRAQDPLSASSFGDADPRRLELLYLHDTRDQFRIFRILEEFLLNPPRLFEQRIIQLHPSIQHVLVERYHVIFPELMWRCVLISPILLRYYDFDESVSRFFLGRKLGSKLRKSVDEISSNTRLPAGSVRRQSVPPSEGWPRTTLRSN
mmetsp:Transcript_45579/g.74271  ORF Transcript_45579/g.74271 Transcript_45579/m.74271 type:complete len:184 (-) Transcript_45579:559-1110(-)